MNSARLVIWNDDACRRAARGHPRGAGRDGDRGQVRPAVEYFARAGAFVEGARVRIPAKLVDDALASAPRSWLLKPRGGDTTPLVLDAEHSYFGTGSDVLYIGP